MLCGGCRHALWSTQKPEAACNSLLPVFPIAWRVKSTLLQLLAAVRFGQMARTVARARHRFYANTDFTITCVYILVDILNTRRSCSHHLQAMAARLSVDLSS